ncbi:hypothetical protein RND71_003438 [Anisodus tanguticus]|uniref:Uncharacterized protein n=1 Tax=Anisodus tanguticus TaxID=243964 RepID=A0AAE1SVX0_9SOLA|nr:hypothetical protein RND71_003438 [Anisodus tanguticus]
MPLDFKGRLPLNKEVIMINENKKEFAHRWFGGIEVFHLLGEARQEQTNNDDCNTSFLSPGEVSQTCFNFYKSEDLVDSSTFNVVSVVMTNVTNADE